eukprot:7378131-Prymnesium_polylepis.4
MSTTESRESAISHCSFQDGVRAGGPATSSASDTSSHTQTFRSKEHEASAVPNSGCIHATRQIEPECAFHSASFCPVSSKILID